MIKRDSGCLLYANGRHYRIWSNGLSAAITLAFSRRFGRGLERNSPHWRNVFTAEMTVRFPP